MSINDSLQNNLRRKLSLIIVTDVNLTLKRAFLQNVTGLLNSTTEKGVLIEFINCFWCFSVTTITMNNA